MSDLLYFLPGGSIGASEIDRLGLAHALGDGSGVARRSATDGPGGRGGVVVARSASPPGYYPDRQTWRPGPGKRWWVGFETDHPPGPEDLARDEPVDGHPVALADGNEWTVPVVRAIAGGTMLPCALVLGEDGRWSGETLEAHARLQSDARRVWEKVISDVSAQAGDRGESEAEELGEQELIRIAVSALTVNYRIGPHEASLLGLLTDTAVKRVALAVVDWPTVVRLQAEGGAEGKEPGG